MGSALLYLRDMALLQKYIKNIFWHKIGDYNVLSRWMEDVMLRLEGCLLFSSIILGTGVIFNDSYINQISRNDSQFVQI